MAAQNEDLYSVQTGFNKYVNNLSGVVSGPNFVDLPTLQRLVIINSVKTPNFRKIKKSQYPLNNYSKESTVIWSPLSDYSQRTWTSGLATTHPYFNDGSYHYLYHVMSMSGYNLSNVTAAIDPTGEAVSRLLINLSDTKTNTLVTAAEMNKTVDHLAKTAKRLFNSLRALKKGDFLGFTNALGVTSGSAGKKRFYRKKKGESRNPNSSRFGEYSTSTASGRTRDFAAETWLEYQYAWKPLLFDVYSHAKALAELNIEHQHVIRRAEGSAQSHADMTVTYRPQYQLVTKRSEERKWSKVGVFYQLQNGAPNAFTQLGIDNPLAVAWELVPFSFVADWFLPIGTYLSNLTASGGYVFHSGFISRRRVCETTLQLQSNGQGSTYSYFSTDPFVGSGFARKQEVFISRERIYSFPAPSFPGFRDPRRGSVLNVGTENREGDGGAQKALSAISLLQSLFLKNR